MFIATFSEVQEQVMTSKVIGVFQSEASAIKALLTVLLEGGFIFSIGEEQIHDSFQDQAYPMNREISEWLDEESTQDLDLFNKEQYAIYKRQFVNIVCKYITSIEQCKKFIEEFEDTYLGQNWTYTLAPVTITE
jgi:hypothetical protein